MDVDSYPTFKVDNPAVVENGIVLKRGGDFAGKNETVLAAKEIANSMMQKVGTYQSGDTIAYTVNINPHGLKLGGWRLPIHCPLPWRWMLIQ